MWGRKSSADRSSDRSVYREERGTGRLAERRQKRRRLLRVTAVFLMLIVCGVAVWGLRQSALRISHVDVFGADPSFSHYATDAMQGSYAGIIPRDSIIFFPESRIRATILNEHTDIAAVSIFRNGLNSISMKLTERTAVARWCGLTPTEGVDAYCYAFDANGFIFAVAEASTTQTINSFSLYAPLVGETLEPLRATVRYADELPSVFDFARQLSTFGSPVTSIVISTSDEVTDRLLSGTAIMYVLGHEQEAFTALVSAKDGFNLTDGSVDYIDLRFGGKVYLKKKAAYSKQ